MISGVVRRANADTQLPILIVLHQENSTPGRVGHALRERGYALDIRKPRFGDPLPETMAGHAGAIIFGGPMSANGSEDFVRREIDWIAVPLKEQQAVPRHLPRRADAGASCRRARLCRTPTVMPRSATTRSVRPRPGCRCAIPGRSRSTNGTAKASTCRAAPNLLAEGDSFPVQAFRYGSGYALQFHPDVTHATICRWTTRGHERMFLPNAKPRAAHFADRAVYDPAGRAWLAAFLNHWLGLKAG